MSDIRVLPQAPTDLTVEGDERGLPVLRFTAPDAGAVYHIYRTYRGSAHEIAQVQAGPDGRVAYLDESAQRLYAYEYFVVAEFPDTGLLSENSASVAYTVPLLPFALPWDFGLSPAQTPEPAPAPSAEPTEPPEPAQETPAA